MAERSHDPWNELERQVTAIGILAAEVERYSGAESAGAAALRAEALDLAARARRLYREPLPEAAAVAALAEAGGEIAVRFRALLDAIRDAPEYHAALAAWRAGDGPNLARYIPAVFADVEQTFPPGPLYDPVSVLTRGSRPKPVAALAADITRLRTEGIAASPDGDGAGTDPALRAVVLHASWENLDTPVALRMDADALPCPVFRHVRSGEMLVYVERLLGPWTVVLAAGPSPERWPDAGVDYVDFLSDLRAALDAAGCPYVFLSP
jgi:hypothetical protein